MTRNKYSTINTNINININIHIQTPTPTQTTNKMTYKQLRYGPHQRHVVSIYDHMFPLEPITPLVFIHGGAWRDHSNTDRDADELYQQLSKVIPLCSVDYRLSDEVKHPVFVEDVIDATKMCLKQFNTSKVSFIGHSAGAMLSLQCLLNMNVEKLYLVDGIYDLQELIREYPEYKFFVDDAFDQLITLSLDKLNNVEVHIIHSYEDELLSIGQTSWLQNKLTQLGVPFHLHVAHLGKHNDVYKSKALADYINKTYI